MNIRDAAGQFLACKRIAVTGVSRNAKGHGANSVAKRLRERGYTVFNINPNAPEIDGQPCYPSLKAVPGGVEAVVIGTKPERALGTVQEAAELGVKLVWMHSDGSQGSVSLEAAAYGRQHGMTVIDGGCPLMFGPASDGGHRFMCWYLTLTGKIPRVVT